MATYIKRDLYTEVTARILAELERGAVPWVPPLSEAACDAVTCSL
jgi:antirestriction protein ArdC